MPISKQALQAAAKQNRAGNLPDSTIVRMVNQYKAENLRPESAPGESFPVSTFAAVGPPAPTPNASGVPRSITQTGDAASEFIQSPPEGSAGGITGTIKDAARFIGGAVKSPFDAVDRIAQQTRGPGGVPFGIAQAGVELRDFVEFLRVQGDNTSKLLGPGALGQTPEQQDSVRAQAYEDVRATGFLGPFMAAMGAKGIKGQLRSGGGLIERGARETTSAAKLTGERVGGKVGPEGLTPSEAAKVGDFRGDRGPAPITLETSTNASKSGNLTHDDLVRASETAANELNQRGLNAQLNAPVQRTPYQQALEGVTELRGAREHLISQKPKKATKKYKTRLRAMNIQLEAAETKMNTELNKQLYPFISKTESPVAPATPLEMRMDQQALNNFPRMSIADPPGQNPLTNLGGLYSPRQHRLLRLYDRVRNKPFTYSRTSANRMARPEVRMETSPAGRVYDTKTNKAVTWSRSLEAEATVPVQDAISGLTRFDRDMIRDGKFAEAYESQKAQASETLSDLAAALKKSSDLLFDKTSPLLGTRRRSNWMAHQITPAAKFAIEARKGKLWEAIVAEHPHLNERSEMLTVGSDLPVTKQGSAEFSRSANLKRSIIFEGKSVDLINSNPLDAFTRYAHEVTRRAGIVKEFGKGEEGMRDILRQAGDDLNLKVMLKQQWKTLNGIGDMPSFHTSLWGRASMGMESVARTAQLSLSVVPNTLGTLQSMRMFGINNTLRAMGDVLKGNKVVSDSRLVGGWAEGGLDMLAGTEGLGPKFGFGKKVGDLSRKALEATMLGKVEGFTNKTSGLAAVLQASDMFNSLRNIARDPTKFNTKWRRVYGADAGSIVADFKRRYRFTETDIARIMDKGLGAADKARILQRAPSLVNQFIEGPNQRSRFMRHEVFRSALAYTSFIRLRGNMMADVVFHAKHGNIKPLVKFMGFAALEGEAEIWLKGVVKNRERVDKNFWDRLINDWMASATFGYMGPLQQSYGYTAGKNPAGRAAQMVVPPYLMWYGELAMDIYEASQMKPRKLGKFAMEKARRLAPIIDAAEANRLRVFDPSEAKRQRNARKRADLAQNRQE